MEAEHEGYISVPFPVDFVSMNSYRELCVKIECIHPLLASSPWREHTEFHKFPSERMLDAHNLPISRNSWPYVSHWIFPEKLCLTNSIFPENWKFWNKFSLVLWHSLSNLEFLHFRVIWGIFMSENMFFALMKKFLPNPITWGCKVHIISPYTKIQAHRIKKNPA